MLRSGKTVLLNLAENIPYQKNQKFGGATFDLTGLKSAALNIKSISRPARLNVQHQTIVILKSLTASLPL